MFCMQPSQPTRPEDYVITRAGRPLHNTRVTPTGLTPRRLAQAALQEPPPPNIHWIDPRPWIAAPFVLLTDVIAAADPWTGALLDPRHPQPLPVGGLLRLLGPQDPDVPSVHCLVWPDAQLRPAGIPNDPRSVAAFLDEPAIAHFTRALDRAEEVLGSDDQLNDVAQAVTSWIAETLRTTVRDTHARAAQPAPPPPRRPRTAAPRPRAVTCRWC